MRQIDTVVLIVSIILLYIQPYVLIRSMNTFIGRLVSIIILVLASLYSTLSGIVLAMVMVAFTDTIYEGMSADAESREKAEAHSKSHSQASPDIKRTSVTSELLDSNYDTNTYSVNVIENTKSGASIIGDAPGKQVGSATTDLKGNTTSSIMFSNVPSTANFRKNHCKTKNGKTVFVDEKGKELKMADIKKKYTLNFTNGNECNPCEESCSYTVSDGSEQLHNEENLRPKQASMF
jgi:hypothetical protein